MADRLTPARRIDRKLLVGRDHPNTGGAQLAKMMPRVLRLVDRQVGKGVPRDEAGFDPALFIARTLKRNSFYPPVRVPRTGAR